MNSKSLLGDNMPTGGKRIAWNTAMLIAAGLASFGSFYALWAKLQWVGIGILVAFIALAVVIHFTQKKKA